ncbi:TetR family transcriptional regulator [Blastochloris tepida]|uniref:TetR family transcriptional regulator n=1 Tax=Blastochloris tepida TaxID=2233851 RepID=A0A348G4N4_9HYPH|nr:TetR family transcriptional regulator [Blastochloris tepida]
MAVGRSVASRHDDQSAPLRSGGDTPEARDTRARIVETAERLFRLYGYQKTTVADIARELGMSPANVYRFFPSKGAINEEVAASLVNRLLVTARAIAARPEPATARLASVVRTVHVQSCALFLDDRKMHDMVAVAMDENWSVVQDYIDAFVAIVGAILAEGASRGEFAPDAAASAKPAFGAFAAFFHPQLIEQCLREREEGDLDQMLRLVVRGLGGDPARIPPG